LGETDDLDRLAEGFAKEGLAKFLSDTDLAQYVVEWVVGELGAPAQWMGRDVWPAVSRAIAV